MPIVGAMKEKVTVTPHPGGVKGALMSLDEVARKMWASRNDPRVRSWATQQLAKAGSPTGARDKAQAIVDAYRKKVPYVPDPVQSEFMASPIQTLCLDDHGVCIIGGDCDDATITCGACLLSIGIPVQVVGASYQSPTDQPVHVYFQFQDDSGAWVPADATTKFEVGNVHEPARTWVIDPNKSVGAAGLPGGDFVSVGRVPVGVGVGPRSEGWEDWGDLRAPGLTPAQRIADARHSVSIAQTMVQSAQSVIANAQANENGRAWWEHTDVVAQVPFLIQAVSRACSAATEAAAAAADAASTCASARPFAASAASQAAAICRANGCCGTIALRDSCGIQSGTLDVTFYRCVVAQVNAAAGVVNSAIQALLACTGSSIEPAPGRTPIPVRQGPRPVPITWALAGRPMGLGVVTPGDVLAYRSAWNQYVVDTVACAQGCAQAYAAVAAKQSDPNTKKILTGIGQATQKQADSLLAQWNVYAGTSDAMIVLEGSSILQSYQQTVLNAGQVRQSITTGSLTCSLIYTNAQGQVVQAVQGVDPSVQAQIISRIEGLGILASGVLQILVETTGNALVVAGSAAQWGAQQVGNVTKALSTPWPWIALIAGAGAFALWELRR